MLTCMVLLQLRSSAVVQASGSVPILEQMLDILDKYNRLAPGLHREDKEDLSWPGVWSEYIDSWSFFCLHSHYFIDNKATSSSVKTEKFIDLLHVVKVMKSRFTK